MAPTRLRQTPGAQLAEPLFTHLRDRIRMFEGFAQTESAR